MDRPCRSRRRALALLAVAATAGACGSVPPPKLKAPSLSFRDLTIAQANFEQIRLLVTVDADNPNDVDLPVGNLRFELDLMDQPFASGAALEKLVTLARGARRAVPIELSVPTARLLDVLRQALRSREAGALPYRLRGSATWGADGVALPFERRGTVDATRALAPVLRR